MNQKKVPRRDAAPVMKNKGLQALVKYNPRQTVRDMAEQLGVDSSTISKIW